jgi:hypothetical protein
MELVAKMALPVLGDNLFFNRLPPTIYDEFGRPVNYGLGTIAGSSFEIKPPMRTVS